MDLVRTLKIADRELGAGRPCFIIAEAGVNHNGELARALALVDVAAEAGADAVKFQTFSAARLVSKAAPKADYQYASTNVDETQYEMLAKLELNEREHRILYERCAERGILFLSTPFDEEAADLLGELGVAAYKTPSGELTNLPFLRHVASKGKPMIVSTGMATLAEVDDALATIEAAGCYDIAILHCVSAYPAAAGTVNLRAIRTLERAFGYPGGYSDHTEGLAVAFAAVALGACIVEKHFTLDRSLPGPDHKASLEPAELSALVDGIRVVEDARGDGRKRPTRDEIAMAAVARKSLIAIRAIEDGSVIDTADVRAMRPGTGISPALREHVVGRRARAAIAEGTIIAWEMLA